MLFYSTIKISLVNEVKLLLCPEISMQLLIYVLKQEVWILFSGRYRASKEFIRTVAPYQQVSQPQVPGSQLRSWNSTAAFTQQRNQTNQPDTAWIQTDATQDNHTVFQTTALCYNTEIYWLSLLCLGNDYYLLHSIAIYMSNILT